MLATLAGDLCLLVGLAVLLLPLLATELSRPRDGAWGAVVLLLGLVLVTSSDRLRGAPMLGVVCAGLLISRLGAEAGQARWQQLSDEERQRLTSRERWATSIQQLTAVLASLTGASAKALKSLKPPAKTGTHKLWIRPEPPSPNADGDGSPVENSNKDTATPETLDTNKGAPSTEETSNDETSSPANTNQSPKRWVRPDKIEPPLQTSESSSTSLDGEEIKTESNKSDVSEIETTTSTSRSISSDSRSDPATDSTLKGSEP